MEPSGRIPEEHRIIPVLEAALGAVEPAAALKRQVGWDGRVLRVGRSEYCLGAEARLFVVGAGKAGAPMAEALFQLLGERVSAGLVVVKKGHTGRGSQRVSLGSGGSAYSEGETAVTGPIRLAEGGHPLPDEAGLAAARGVVDLITGLRPDDLVLVLLSGGGSALLPLPAPGLTLSDVQETTSLLVRSGAEIREVNAVRKHCSALQGGQLARLAAPARIATLIVSDVVGSPLDAIASGPTVPDPTSFADAMEVLTRYALVDRVPPPVRRRLERGGAGLIPETPKPADPLFERADTMVVCDNAVAARAGAEEARRQGWRTGLLTSRLQGEAREVGRVLAGVALGIAAGESEWAPPACLVFGGETTVTVRGGGRGGRNQELALAAAIALDRGAEGLRPAVVVSLGTDGNDGPTDAAGAVATTETLAAARRIGLNAGAALAANDSYRFFSALGQLLVTGPTNTNVNDLMFVFVPQGAAA